MRAWLLTNHTYGTWLPGDPRGSVTSVRDRRPNDRPAAVRIEHDIPGEPLEDDIPGLYRSAIEHMKGPPIHMNVDQADVLLGQFQETAGYRAWTLRAVAIISTHFHIVVQVPDDPDPGRVLADFKAYGTRALSRRYGKPQSETWWTENGSKRKLRDELALAAAIHYVLFRQECPLVVWSPELGRIV
jgi:hypothetical protein